MGKIINTYRGYTATELKTRSDIPSTATYIVTGATSINISNLTTDDIGNVIGETYTTVSQLCKSAKINKWSAYSPYIRTVTGSGVNGIIGHELPTKDYSMGSFAGYNHTAVTPSYYNTNRTTTISTSASATVTFECDFTLGELIITNNDIQGVAEILGIVFTIWDGATLKGYQIRDIDSGKDEWRAGTSLGFSVDFTGPASNSTTYTCKLFFNNDRTTYSYNSSELCQVFSTELPQYSKIVRVQTSSTDIYHSTPYTPTFVSGAWTLSTGHLSFQDLTLNHTYSTGLRVQTWVEQYNLTINDWERVTSVTTIRDINRNQPYTTGSSIASYYNVHIWTTLAGAERAAPVPDYDYRCVILYDGA